MLDPEPGVNAGPNTASRQRGINAPVAREAYDDLIQLNFHSRGFPRQRKANRLQSRRRSEVTNDPTSSLSAPPNHIQEPTHVSIRKQARPDRHSLSGVGFCPVRRACPAGRHGWSQVRQAPHRQFPLGGIRRGRLQRRREAGHCRRQFPLPGPRFQAAEDPFDQGFGGRAGQGLLQRLHERPRGR